MLNIKLEKDILLTSDENQLLLKKEIGVNKEGKMRYRILGFYATLEQSLNGYVKVKIKASEATTLKELLNEIKSLKEYIKKIANAEKGIEWKIIARGTKWYGEINRFRLQTKNQVA